MSIVFLLPLLSGCGILKALELVESLENASMGEAQTLTDFLTRGQAHYPTKDSMLILWDPGAGAVKGVCYDENHACDPLTLKELQTALENAALQLFIAFLSVFYALQAGHLSIDLLV